jgi:hypothetical protein
MAKGVEDSTRQAPGKGCNARAFSRAGAVLCESPTITALPAAAALVPFLLNLRCRFDPGCPQPSSSTAGVSAVAAAVAVTAGVVDTDTAPPGRRMRWSSRSSLPTSMRR